MVDIFVIPFIYAFIGSSLFIAIPLRVIDLGVSNPFVLGLAGTAFSIFYVPLCILQSLLSNQHLCYLFDSQTLSLSPHVVSSVST